MLHFETYSTGAALNIDEVVDLYRASSLGERRPVDDLPRMLRMLENANLVITARQGEMLVAIARSLSDYCYATYLSCLAVRASHQRQGIGRELVRRTREASHPATVILLAAPQAVAYYPRLGMQHHPSCWTLKPNDTLL